MRIDARSNADTAFTERADVHTDVVIVTAWIVTLGESFSCCASPSLAGVFKHKAHELTSASGGLLCPPQEPALQGKL